MVAVGVGHRLGAVAGGAPGWLTGLMGWLPGRPTIDAVSHALAATGGVPSVPVHDLAVLAGLGRRRAAGRPAPVPLGAAGRLRPG